MWHEVRQLPMTTSWPLPQMRVHRRLWWEAPMYYPLALLEVKTMLNMLVQGKSASSMGAFAHAKAESVKHRELISKRVQSWASRGRLRLQAWLHRDCGRLTAFSKQRQPYLSPRPTHSKPQPINEYYSKAKAHRNLTGTRLQVHTACTATCECLCIILCCGVHSCNS